MRSWAISHNTPDSKVHVTNIWGPSGADRTQVGPMLAPWTLLSGTVPTDIKALNDVRAVGTVQHGDRCSFPTFLAFQWFHTTFMNQMTSFKLAHEIWGEHYPSYIPYPQNLSTHRIDFQWNAVFNSIWNFIQIWKQHQHFDRYHMKIGCDI